MEDIGIKSKVRVDEYGEVYTPENIVRDMLDLIEEDSYRVECTMLEPACGNGNFLVEILRRKLETAAKADISEYDKKVFIAVSTIYAIDIAMDNIKQSKQRMEEVLKRGYKDKTGKDISSELMRALKYVMDINIICGNSLTGKEEIMQRDIIIAEWKMNGNIVSRTDYRFKDMYESSMFNEPTNEYIDIDFREVYNIQRKTEEMTEEDIYNML